MDNNQLPEPSATKYLIQTRRLVNGEDFAPHIFEGMVLSFICGECGGQATLNRIRAKYEQNASLDRAIRKLRSESKITSARAFGPNGELLHCYKFRAAPNQIEQNNTN